MNTKKIFYIFMLICLMQGNLVHAICEYVNGGSSHQVCSYYAHDNDAAYGVCIEKSESWIAQGWDDSYSCFTTTSGFVQAGWFTDRYPNTFIKVFYDICPLYSDVDVDTGECTPLPPKQPSCGVGNPCDPVTGFKYQPETDMDGIMPLKRTYNSGYLVNVGFGKGWRSHYHKSLLVGGSQLSIVEGTGRGESWSNVNDVWQGDADSDYHLQEQADGSFVLGLPRGGSETYDVNGRLILSTDAKGNQTNYTYEGGQLRHVTNHYGKSLRFTYAGELISEVMDAGGEVYRYEYDANDNLVAVIYPDATPENLADNPRRLYHYENTDFPNHLTGITDENGNRYATYAYEAQGKAILTQHAQTTNAVPQERFELDYQN